MGQDKSFFTTVEAAKLLGTSVRTIQLWVENGALDAWKTAGGHRRIRAESVHAKMQEQNPDYLPPSHATKSKGHRILVVEDNPTVSLFYKAAIDSWALDIDVVSAEDGFQGLVMIGEQKPDLIISDIYMPGMDGLQMIQSLYKGNLIEAAKLIVISGLDEQEINDRGGIPAGVTFFNKPVDVQQLKSLVLDKLNLHGAGGASQ